MSARATTAGQQQKQQERHSPLASHAARPGVVRGAPPSTPRADMASQRVPRSTAGSSSTTGQPDRVGNYTIREEIGRGSFATVYRGENLAKQPPTPVAIKAVVRSKLTSKLLENLESEISLLKNIKQRNVVELVDCLKTETHIYLVMAYCSAGDLSQYIRRRGQVPGLSRPNGPSEATGATSGADTPSRHTNKYPHPRDGGLNEMVVRCFLGQLSEALKFLREKNIVHRDIKPQNLLLHPASPSDIAAGHPAGIPLLQVADFGFARALPSTSLAETLCGSPLYMAPEILRYEKYGAKADLWSVGAVAYEMCTGKPPFRAQNHVELLRRIEKGEDRIRFPDEQQPVLRPGETTPQETDIRVPPDIKDLIRRLLKRNPVERMSFYDFFEAAEKVARWGEGSIAPGSIEINPAAPAQQPSEAAQSNKTGLALQQHARSSGTPRVSRKPSGTIEDTPRAPLQQLPPQSVVANVPAHVVMAPPMHIPSTAAEQEPAFVKPSATVHPQLAGTQGFLPSSRSSPLQTPVIGPPNPAATEANSQASSTADVHSSSNQQPGLPRRQTFPPKYVVGPSGNSVEKARATSSIRVHDFAAPTTVSAPATPPLHSRRPSADLGQSSRQSGPPLVTPLKSNLTLALPQNAQQNRRAQDLAFSGLTGDEDSFLGKEYVVVEKRSVEVNSLADEVAAQPRRANTLSRRNSRGFLSRQLGGLTSTSPSAGVAAINAAVNNAGSPSPPSPAPYPPSAGAAAAYEHPPFATRPALQTYGSSPSSRLRNASYSSSPGRYVASAAAAVAMSAAARPLSIPSAAIAQALNMASLKLFGSPSENIWLRKRGHRVPVERTALPETLDPAEESLLSQLEDLAQKATVIFDFADSKFLLMIPGQMDMKASISNPFHNHVPPAGVRRDSASPADRPTPISPMADRDRASQPSPGVREPDGAAQTPSSQSTVQTDMLPGETAVLYLKSMAFLQRGIDSARGFWTQRSASGQNVSTDFVDYIQWFRSRFNECYEKVEYAKSRLTNDIPDLTLLAERLIFDRALEMSRAAAVNELLGETPSECELAYDTALWMLYAILDDSTQGTDVVEDDDRQTVQNFIKSIQGRLDALRRKIRSSRA